MFLVGRLHWLAMCGLIGLAVFSTKPARSQTDLNRFMPRATPASVEVDEVLDDEAPEDTITPGRSGSAPRHR